MSTATGRYATTEAPPQPSPSVRIDQRPKGLTYNSCVPTLERDTTSSRHYIGFGLAPRLSCSAKTCQLSATDQVTCYQQPTILLITSYLKDLQRPFPPNRREEGSWKELLFFSYQRGKRILKLKEAAYQFKKKKKKRQKRRDNEKRRIFCLVISFLIVKFFFFFKLCSSNSFIFLKEKGKRENKKEKLRCFYFSGHSR